MCYCSQTLLDGDTARKLCVWQADSCQTSVPVRSSAVGLMPAHLPRLTGLLPQHLSRRTGCAMMSLAQFPNMSLWCDKAMAAPGLWCSHCPGPDQEPATHHLTTNTDQLPGRYHLVLGGQSLSGQCRGRLWSLSTLNPNKSLCS